MDRRAHCGTCSERQAAEGKYRSTTAVSPHGETAVQQERKTTALASGAAPPWRAWLAHTNPIVFLCASGAVLLIGALLIVRPGASQAWLEAAQLLVAAH